MKRKYKVALFMVVIAVIAGIITTVLIKKNRAKQDCSNPSSSSSSNGECKVDLSSIQTTTSAVASTSASATASPVPSNVYQSLQYGFEITFNSAWKGYTVSQKSEDKAEVVYDIGITTKDSNIANGIAVPLTIKVFNKADYQANPTLTKITENDKYVFAYSIWEQAPSDAAVTEKDIANVIATFKLI